MGLNNQPFVDGLVFLLYNAIIRKFLGGGSMKRRIVALFTAFLVLFSSTALGAKKDIKEAYSNNLRIGLKNMMTTSLKVTFNGSYKAAGQLVTPGTSLAISQINGKILFNNTEYDEITFVPDNPAASITLEYGAKKYNFLGSMTFKALADGNILPINIVDVENYLKGVVGYEMSNSYPVEALKAQAVAARNFALANVGKHGSEGYDLSDGTSDQVYRGYNSSYGNVIKAVDETKGMVLAYNDSLVSGFYSASNGGYTESSKNAWFSDIPYLQVKQDDFDLTKWPQDKKFTTADMDTKLKSKGILTDQDKFIRLNIDTIQRNESTRVSGIEVVYANINGAENIKTISKEKAWSFLSLPSSLYSVTYDAVSDTYTFSGMGNGHGVGLSQIGAKNRANAGQKYDEILSFYYTGTQLKSVGDIIEGFSISKYEAYVGDTISFNAKASSYANTLFKYTVENNGQIIYTREYSNDPNASYTVDRAGYFTVHLYTKAPSSSREYDEHKTVSFSAISLLEIAGINVLSDSVVVKKPVTVNVEINGGAAAGVEYKFEAEKDHIIFHSGTSDVPSFTFTPQFTGEYTLYVSIRDKAGNKSYDDMESIKITVNAEGSTTTAPSRTVMYSITRNLKKGVSGNDVKKLQSALKTLGYFNYPSLTTYFGDATVSAVKAFQKKSGLTANGLVDSKTAAAINSALVAKAGAANKIPAPPPSIVPAFSTSRTLKLGMSGNDVKQLQTVLKKLGFFNYSSITNYFGTVTQTSVKAFQKANGMSQTGVVDAAVVKKINEKIK